MNRPALIGLMSCWSRVPMAIANIAASRIPSFSCGYSAGDLESGRQRDDPGFAVGRTQDLLFHLGCLHYQGELDHWQVFLDSPMAIAVTRVYDRWLKLLDGEDIRHLSDAHKNSLEKFLPTLNLASSTEESMAINRIKGGAIIIAGSGMCTGGRIRHHFKQRIWDRRNTIIFTGYQARDPRQGHRRWRTDDQDVRRRVRGQGPVETLGGLSAHAGQSELLQWIDGFRPPRARCWSTASQGPGRHVR